MSRRHMAFCSTVVNKWMVWRTPSITRTIWHDSAIPPLQGFGQESSPICSARACMSTGDRVLLSCVCLLVFFPVHSSAASLELSNSTTTATFGPGGLVSLTDSEAKAQITLTQDDWSLVIDGDTLRSEDTRPTFKKTAPDQITYNYVLPGYRVQAIYRLGSSWQFVSNQLRILRTQAPEFTVHQIVPWDLALQNTVASSYVPSTYVPQLGA